eukprot:CAMPEP_0119326910 /NCGR_PEP_ID=MMETSP1333-20130426/69575_1 /TAXON_ID=418940 /ORGANISM="Scyphosphaera apsteinii, Strain RCC1455" /LENGTH=318 /DNA_ID=CAMNT_0007335349 /DNA_START=390 /DNA_END=1346 /DNA_ORIENTATION=-
MPEGPECTVHAERLNTLCSNKMIVRAEILSGRYHDTMPVKWNEFQRALPATIDSVHSKGKFIWWRLTPKRTETLSAEKKTSETRSVEQLTLWSTLGMTGAWSLTPSLFSRVVIQLHQSAPDGQQRMDLYYNDQRNFGTLTVCTDDEKLAAKLASLGPSWLAHGGLSLERFMQVVRSQCKNKRSANVAVAKFLMNQGKTSGIGNYILSETLYLARIYPWAICGDLDEEAWTAVHAAAVDVISRSYSSQAALAERASIAQQQLSATFGTLFSFELYVYRKKRSPEGHPVLKDTGPHGRSVFWVSQRQTRGSNDHIVSNRV